MAKRKKQTYRTRTKTITRYAKTARTKAGGLIAGIIAGAGGGLINRFLPLGAWSQPAADLVSGHFMGNEALTTIGGRQIGLMLVNGVGNGTTNGNGLSLLQ